MGADGKAQMGADAVLSPEGAKDRAFTLMELLIAVSIFSIIALCLYSTFAGGLGIWKRQEKAFRSRHNVRLALDTMAKELRNMIDYSQPKNIGAVYEPPLLFNGDEKQLTFITLVGEKIAKIDYIFETPSDRGGVLKKRTVFQEEGFQEEKQREEVFIKDLEGITFEYAYKGDGEDSEPIWRKSWAADAKEGAAKIPVGVRITLGIQGPDRKEKEILRKTVFIPTGSLEEYNGL